MSWIHTISLAHSLPNDLRFLHWFFLDLWLHYLYPLSHVVDATSTHVFQTINFFYLSGSPDDWECFLDYLGCLLEDDSSWCNGADTDPIHPSKSADCKLTHLSDEVVHISILALHILLFGTVLSTKVHAEFDLCDLDVSSLILVY